MSCVPLADRSAGASGRVFIGPAPDLGAHFGYRGKIHFSLVGVHLRAGEVAFGPHHKPHADEETDEHGWVWEVSEQDQLIPWHQVHSISWGEQWAL